ncbi:MAG: FAE1/Type III polyketide synthase-like protein-domain-containing protein [Monoraphidium minutum]|nr:MAG: FAE1/Type III polyketide synthase-like protein-domain-containing protein [Monoraphidium minutum]
MKLQKLHASGELEALFQYLLTTRLEANLLTLALAALALGAVWLYRALNPGRPVYMLDFAMAVPPEDWKFPRQKFLKASSCNPDFTKDDMEFQERIAYRSGLGDDTTCPPSGARSLPPPCPAHPPAVRNSNPNPPGLMGHPFFFDMAHARLEFEVTCFSAVQELLTRTGITPRQISAIVVNSSLFNPTPSLSAMIMNRFKFPSSTINYNLGGMGCSASLISIDLARKVLQINPNTYVLVVAHENITNNWYPGKDRSMLVPNCIFRANGAAMLLTNKAAERGRAKYQLRNLVRVNMAGSDKGYSCVYQTEDENGDVGVRLSKDLTSVAAEALMTNLNRLGPQILPLSEKLLFAANMISRKLYGKKKVAPYVPDFMTAVDHVCIHSGGRAVIDGMQKALRLSDAQAEPSRATLYKWGNVSSSSVWYVLAYLESFKGLRRGEKVWQLSFGSGFKCNSAVWQAVRRIDFVHPCWADFDAAKMRLDLGQLSAKIAEEKAARRAAGGEAQPRGE